MDAAYYLVQNDKRVRVLDARENVEDLAYAPSVSLSPFTQTRLESVLETGRLEMVPDARVTRVMQSGRGYKTVCDDDTTHLSSIRPILATGFAGSLDLVREHFAWNERSPILTQVVESTLMLFLCGPMTKHDKMIFCFIYKFRQRFAVVANEIAGRLGLKPMSNGIAKTECFWTI